jgi:hypothetical protein
MPRKSKSKPVLSYVEMYQELTPKVRQEVNEKMIWAVLKLNDEDDKAPEGTKVFLEDRGKQFIRDLKIVGYNTATNRFKAAVYTKKDRAESIGSLVVGTHPMDLLKKGQ